MKTALRKFQKYLNKFGQRVEILKSYRKGTPIEKLKMFLKTHTHTHTRIQTYTHTHSFTHSLSFFLSHTHTHTLSLSLSFSLSLYIYIYIYIYTNTLVGIHISLIPSVLRTLMFSLRFCSCFFCGGGVIFGCIFSGFFYEALMLVGNFQVRIFYRIFLRYQFVKFFFFIYKLYHLIFFYTVGLIE